MSHVVILGLGGNQGDVKETLQLAINLIENQLGKVNHVSSQYQTKAWGVEDQADFINQAIVLTTLVKPTEVLNTCLEIEQILGRKRGSNRKWKERIIDIDVLFYDNLIIETTALTLPHPYIHKRNFVLYPLTEIIPEYMHPILNKTVVELKKLCKDNLAVIKILD